MIIVNNSSNFSVFLLYLLFMSYKIILNFFMKFLSILIIFYAKFAKNFLILSYSWILEYQNLI